MERWKDTKAGGVWIRTDDRYLSRPFDRVGMNHIRFFENYNDAIAYADKASR